MKRIMIVEDEAAIREFEAINLKRVGYTVVEAGSGEEALDIYDNDPEGFDIALLDISMPEWMGLPFAKNFAKEVKRWELLCLPQELRKWTKSADL